MIRKKDTLRSPLYKIYCPTIKKIGTWEGRKKCAKTSIEFVSNDSTRKKNRTCPEIIIVMILLSLRDRCSPKSASISLQDTRVVRSSR